MKKISQALVTGASSGIGKELCRLLANQGIDLMIAGRDTVSLQSLADELYGKVRIHTFVGDLCSVEDRKLLIDSIYHYLPDLVVNNAGAGLYGDALTYKTSEQMKVLSLNAEAAAEITLEAARALYFANQPGTILNVSSVSAFQVFPGLAMYSASKAFLNQFSLAMDEEMKPFGIRVPTSCPGVVETQFRRRASGDGSMDYESFAMDSGYAAMQIWKQILSQRTLRIFDWKYRLLKIAAQMIPTFISSAIVHRLMKQRSYRTTFISRSSGG